MSAITLILTILGVVEPVLSGQGVIPAAYQGLATGILNAIGAVKTALTGPNAQIDIGVVSVTQAIASGLQALETAGALPSTGNASLALAMASAAAAGAAAYTAAAQKVDPTQLQPEAPVS
jgi:hypothetical protein